MAKKRVAAKTAIKTAQAYATPGKGGTRLPVGNHPGNTGGKKGRSGRPPMAFKRFVALLRQDPTIQDELERVLRDGDSRHYAAALRVIVDYDDQLPSNQLTNEERLARIAELQRLAQSRADAAG